VELGGRIHVFGGENSRRVFDEHEVYDPATGRWTSNQPLPTGRHGHAVAAVGGRIYVIAGGPEAGVAQTDVVEIYTP
jgi:N-acetylneuraminic acid mutarotase